MRKRPRPTSIENLEAVPAVPIRTEPRALPPPPPVFGPEPVGQLVQGVECPEPEGLQVYPNPDSCNQFYKCANGTLTLETCGNGLLFNEATSLAGSSHNHCTYIWQSSCGNRLNDTTPISTPGMQSNLSTLQLMLLSQVVSTNLASSPAVKAALHPTPSVPMEFLQR